jgi:hypothetical protein
LKAEGDRHGADDRVRIGAHRFERPDPPPRSALRAASARSIWSHNQVGLRYSSQT